MYIPPINRVDSWDAIIEFVKAGRSADLVTVDPDGLPLATLMPAIWQNVDPVNGQFGKLVMHMARGNQQWKSITSQTKGLAIVRGAEAYISPSNYENKHTDHKVVPTWNYESVHLSGIVEVSEDLTLLREIVTELTAFHEHTREVSWLAAESDPHYFDLQLKGIVAITLHVEKVEAKSKLSQNKSEGDRGRIVADLENSGIPGESVIAEKMRRLL